MKRHVAPASPLDAILAKMRKRDSSPLGRLQNLTHRYLTRLESVSWIRAYGAFMRRDPLPIGPRNEPVIDVDSVFWLSLFFHLLILVLLAWATVKSGPPSQPGPIQVRFMEVAKQVQRPAAKRSKVARRRPKPAPRRPKPAPRKKPLPLPAPKVVAQAPSQNPATFTPKSVASMVQLPTHLSTAAPAPQLSAEATPATAVETFSKEDLTVPKGLIQGERTPTVAGRTSAMQSPDFAAYLDKIKRKVQSACEEAKPGCTVSVLKIDLLIVIDRGGNLVRAEPLKSTNPGLNDNFLKVVRSASPFPVIPKNLVEALADSPLRIRFTVGSGLKGTP